MILPNFFNFFKTKDFHDGFREGFDVAESHIKDLAKSFEREVRKGLLKNMATRYTATNHKCNCEFCEFGKK